MSNSDLHKELLNQIIEIELIMFQATPNQGGPASCQKNPDLFRIMRWMAHCKHQEPTLRSYLADLQAAQESGRNLMLEKYARMDNLIPTISTNPHIEMIAITENMWLEEAATLYPYALQGQGKFKNYLACELETLSDSTLDLYAQEIIEALQTNRNLVLEQHDLLCQHMGYTSLAARNAQLAEQANQTT